MQDGRETTDAPLLDITFAEGKYRIRQNRDGSVEAFRHGEPWPARTQSLLGDGMVLALAYELDAARRA